MCPRVTMKIVMAGYDDSTLSIKHHILSPIYIHRAPYANINRYTCHRIVLIYVRQHIHRDRL